MRVKVIAFSLISLVLFSISVVLPVQIQAAPQTDLSISPAINEWTVDPGGTQTSTVVVRNMTGEPMPISTTVQAFLPQEVIDPQNRHIFDASKWFSIEKPDFIIPKKASQNVPILLNVPKDAEPGGHYATVYFNQLRPVSSQVRTHTVGKVGMLAFVTVKGRMDKSLRLTERKVQQKGGGFLLSAALKHNGNVHVLPQVAFDISDWRGRKITTTDTSGHLVLPATTRWFEVSWKAPSFGIFKATPRVTIDNKPLHLQVAPVLIFNIPFFEILLLVLFVTFGYFGIYRQRKRWRDAWKALWVQ